MAEQERSRETTAPPEKVWTIWSDTSTWPSWNPDVKAISLDGPFQNGTTGAMTTRAGTNKIYLENIVPGRSFDLRASPLPLTDFHFHCEITPTDTGSRISQGLTMTGTLAPLFMPIMGGRLAQSFGPILDGLAREAESSGVDNGG